MLRSPTFSGLGARHRRRTACRQLEVAMLLLVPTSCYGSSKRPVYTQQSTADVVSRGCTTSDLRVTDQSLPNPASLSTHVSVEDLVSIDVGLLQTAM